MKYSRHGPALGLLILGIAAAGPPGCGCDREVLIVGDSRVDDSMLDDPREEDAEPRAEPQDADPAEADVIELDSAEEIRDAPDEDAPPSIGWARTYGGWTGDYLRCLQRTAEGGFIAAGLYGVIEARFQQAPLWVLKLTVNGGIEWQTFIIVSHDTMICNSILETSDGGYMVGGVSQYYPGESFLLRLSPGGNVLWAKEFSDEANTRLTSLQKISDGSVVGAGWTSPDRRYKDFWVVKMDEEGNRLWEKAYGGFDSDHCESFDETLDGGIVLAGDTDSFETDGYAAWVLRLDAEGGLVWQKYYDLGYSNYYSDIKTIDNGRFVLKAWANSGQTWILLLDEAGNILRQRLYDGGIIVYGSSLVLDLDGNLIYAGWDAQPDLSRIFIMKLDLEGNILWESIFGGAGLSASIALVPLPEGGYVMAGGTEAFGAGGFDALVLRLDAQGRLPPGCPLNIPVDAPLDAEETFAAPVETSVTALEVISDVTDAEYSVLEASISVQDICD